MQIKSIKKLNCGLSSYAYILNNEYIQLIGKRPDSFDTYKDIKSNADLLEGKISCVDYPHNMELIEPNNKYKYGSLIYPMVRGNTLNIDSLTADEKEKLAKKLVQFNKEMHSLDIHWNREKSIKHEIEKINRNIEILKDYLDEINISKLLNYSKIFENYLKSKQQFCITHGDLWADNLIVNDNNELTGIIDFGNMSYFLPEVDYASLWNLENGFLDLLLKYSDEDITKESVCLFAVHRELCSFEYIVNTNPEEIPCQLKKLTQTLKMIESQIKSNKTFTQEI